MNRFHCHRVPDSFQLKVFGFVEVRRGPLDCPELHWFVRYRACFLGGWDSGDFPGLCKKTLHETTPLCGMEQHGIPVVPTCLLSTFVGTGLSWFYFVCSWTMEAIGRRWSLLGWI